MTFPGPAALLADLRQEGDLLEELLRPLSAEDWDRPTPAEGWTIRHQIAHLTWTERTMLTALEEPEVFAQLRERFRAEPGVVDRGATEGATRSPAEILASWQDSRRNVLERLAAVPQGERIPWIGPPMGASMMASARIMETFAHGQDVRDALGVPPVASYRLRHVAHLGVATRDYAFRQRRLDPPVEPFRVELTHENETWTWGPAEAAQRVHGPALDFALLATRRRHRQDGRLVAEGFHADAWLDIVQAFAGRPGPGRAPLSPTD
ncbi:TIGR03084 family metal-binding protein [Kocuria rosea]|uniref:TIGR03084 family protein n=1 Tax=Kocuria rosea TaxID=1275 RepID=A0A4V3B3J9_KOCRO|nr:TIGR03084 family metal-binding protein [Kocuria rosea]TDL44660.1 TIGR03084 family protein [Kocuria rosea]